MVLEKKIKTELQTILKTLMDLHCSRPFREPVDGRRYPDYYLIVSQPMDLKTLRKNVIDNKYDTPDDFYKETQTIFSNCKLYSIDPMNPVRVQCDELERNFEYQWQNFIARRQEEQGLDHLSGETAEVLSLVHACKRKPEPEMIMITVPPPPVKKQKQIKPDESLSVSLVIPEPTETPEEPVEKHESIILKLPTDTLEPKVIFEDELNFDKLQGRESYENVIKFKVPELAPEPVPVREVPVVIDIPPAQHPDSEEYIRAALSPFLSPETAKLLRRRVVEVLHKYSYDFIPLDST